MTTPITPTIGRRVYYTPREGECNVIDPTQPCDAGIVYVWTPPGCVNLDVCDHKGQHFAVKSALHDDDCAPGTWRWMPYQKAQAGIEPMPRSES